MADRQTTAPQAPTDNGQPPMAAQIPPTPPTEPPNMEKRDPVSQMKNDHARFERVLQFIQAHPTIFAKQGAVLRTWRTHRGQRLGPYYQLAYRDNARQQWIYLGRSEELVRRVRNLLAELHRPRDQRRLSRRLQAQVRASLKCEKARLKQFCAIQGIHLKGWEFRGIRKACPPPR